VARRTLLKPPAVITLNQVLDEMPFSIQRIQTDRGTEFFAEAVQRRLGSETTSGACRWDERQATLRGRPSAANLTRAASE
jgi:hypothetical protein